MRKDTVTRAELIKAAADLWSEPEEGETLPFWDASEYMRGLVELIAKAAGADSPSNYKTEVWEQIATAVTEAEKLRQARAYARQNFDNAHDGLDKAELLDAIAEAYLAGMTQKESAR